MKINEFERIAGMDEVTPARPKRVMVGELEVVLFQIGDEIFPYFTCIVITIFLIFDY